MRQASSANRGSDEPFPKGGGYVLLVLVLAYTLSYADRTILTLLVQPIRTSLQISDIEFSLLHGLAFALLYTLLGIPIARLSDRFNRTVVISAGVAVWSAMTALCGLSRSFGQMFLARIGVGIGEAALSPAAFSILSDYFSPRHLTQALSVYSAAVYVGSGVAMIAGGAMVAAVPALELPVLGHLEPWQVVFLSLGLPGIAMVGLMATVREPARRGLLPIAAAGQSIPLREVVRYVTQRKAAYGFLFAGYSAHGLMWGGVSAWIPAYFMRTHRWPAETVGLRFGLVLMTFGTLGIMCGGMVGGWLRDRGRRDANLILGMLSCLVMLPAGVSATLMSNDIVALTFLGVFVFFASFPYGGAAAACQEITPNQMRAQVTALFFFVFNLVGSGLGPTAVAVLTDAIFHDDLAVKYSMSALVALAAPLAFVLLWRGLRPYRESVLAMKL